MGIPDLLKFVEKAKEKNLNIINFQGKTLAVDASCFIYKGLYSQSEDDLLGRKSTKCVDYLLKTAKIIVNAGIHAIFVFDGQALPSKKLTNDKRDASREENKKEAMALLKMGNKEEALRRFRRSYSISKEVQVECIQALRDFGNVDIIVAPYEADAELTFLVNSNLAFAAITVDSDLLAFGCERIIYNLNVDSAMCEYIKFSDIQNCFSSKLQASFNSDLLRYICILKGCDYFQGLKGMAFKTADKFFSKLSNRDPTSFIKHIKCITKLDVGDINKFTDEFIRANNTFLYQIIFDPRDGNQKPLNAYPNELLEQNKGHDNSMSSLESGNYLWYAGQVYSPDVARLLAIGNDYDKILENNLQFTTPHAVSLCSIWKNIVTYFDGYLHDQNVSSPSLPSLSRKRKSFSNESNEVEIVSVKRCITSNLQIFDRIEEGKENIKSEINEVSGDAANESSQKKINTEKIKTDTLIVPKKSNAIVKPKPKSIVITESKYFKKTSENVEIKLFSNNIASTVFCYYPLSKPDNNGSQDNK